MCVCIGVKVWLGLREARVPLNRRLTEFDMRQVVTKKGVEI